MDNAGGVMRDSNVEDGISHVNETNTNQSSRSAWFRGNFFSLRNCNCNCNPSAWFRSLRNWRFDPKESCRIMWQRIRTWHFWKVILLGQFLALAICGTAVSSQILQSRHGVEAPTAQGFINYLALALVYMPFFVFRPPRIHNVLRKRWWLYLIIAVADVEANYLLVKAYQYTTLTSVQLLDCITIPGVMILSRIFLKVHYRMVHFAGIIICLGGVSAMIVADAQHVHTPGKNPVLGDVYALIGATLYAVTNVAEEYSVKYFTRLEFLGMIGFFGSFIGGIQLLILERHELVLARWTPEIIGLFIGFGLSMFLLYSLAPVYMRMSSATTFNLSILTADVYVFIFGMALFKFKFSVLYIVSFVAVLIGVTVYHYKDPVIKTQYPKLQKKEEVSPATSKSSGNAPRNKSSHVYEDVSHDQINDASLNNSLAQGGDNSNFWISDRASAVKSNNPAHNVTNCGTAI